MTDIYYVDEENLGHLDGSKKINSFIWKILYKRVQKRLKDSIINIENMKKLIFNKNKLIHCKIDGTLPYVFFRREPSWYCDDKEEYFLPFNMCFTDGKRKYNIVLTNGEIDIRDDSTRRKDLSKKFSHTPVLLLKVFNNIEKSFEILLKYMDKEDKKVFNK